MKSIVVNELMIYVVPFLGYLVGHTKLNKPKRIPNEQMFLPVRFCQKAICK